VSDVYQVSPGSDVAPGLPYVQLPSLGVQPAQAPAPLQVTVKPTGTQKSAPEDEFRDAPDYKPPAAAKATTPGAALAAPPEVPKDGDFTDAPTYAPPPPEVPTRNIGGGEAAWKGVVNGVTLAFAPALQGALEAGGPPDEMETRTGQANPMRLVKGGIALLHNALSEHPDPEVTASYNRGREAALKDQEAARTQHPYAYFAGQMAGSLAVPMGGGAMAPATTGVRVLRGMRAGGIGGGLYGAGEAVSEGKSAEEVAKAAAASAVIGAPLGGVIGGAFGVRVVNPNSPGRAADATARALGRPLSRGVTSDIPSVQATTAKLQELPFVGERIGERTRQTQEAAGHFVGDIAATMGHGDRAAAGNVLRAGLEGAIDNNIAEINAGYNALRGQIDQTARYTMPRTDATVNRVLERRQGKGKTPAEAAEGVDQFSRVARGATFDNAHGARADAREAGNVLTPHPGYNATDYNEIMRAMTADLRDMVQAAATNQTPGGRRAALQAFEQADRRFRELAEQNNALHRILGGSEESIAGTLTGSARNINGNLALLLQLRRSMDPQQFEQIGGLLLAELGRDRTGEFSLSQFANRMRDLSPRALGVLFAPDHVAAIQAIGDMGRHIRRALAATSRGQSGGLIVLLDVAKDAALLGYQGAEFGGYSVAAGVTSAMLYGTAWLLGNPARAASASAWMRAYQGLLQAHTPARIAAFNMTTRNLANTLGIPLEKLTNSIANHLGHAQDNQSSDKRSEADVNLRTGMAISPAHSR
jgi:hypothetical protein